MKIDNKLLLIIIASIALMTSVYIYTQNSQFKQCLKEGAGLAGEKNVNDLELEIRMYVFRKCSPS
tara:strand:+ start:658 stop:852 length:195 start_codon:yes stop_codon:yes gene_type:complete